MRSACCCSDMSVDPGGACQRSVHEVAERWIRLCPVRENGTVDAQACALRRDVIVGDPLRLGLGLVSRS